jgi:O-phospho-L-seryl-tRNASec:L-selenocysteinyl-tRNA synthase
MDSFEEQLSGFVKKSYVNQGLQNEQARKNLLQVLLRHKKLPKKGWNDQTIELLIHELSVMDSNNFMSNAGVGEREGRVYSQLVARRHYGLAHGVGRSGDIAEVQPKAAGSSIIYKLTNCLVTHAMEVAGISPGMDALVLPMATGMSLTLCFIAMKKQRPGAKYIIFPRIDQKSCFKAIMTAGLEPIIVENAMSAEGELSTDVEAVRAQLQLLGEEVLCVLCTTSCFAPRQPDSIDNVAAMCREFGVGHVVNNAYGLQCKAICKLINRAARLGTLTAGTCT